MRYAFIFMALLCFAFTGIQMADAGNELRTAHELQQDLEYGRLADRTNRTIESILKVSYKELRKRGEFAYARWMMDEWYSKWDGYLVRYAARDLGDHAPFSKFLAEVHAKIEATIGLSLCETLRIHDLYIINYAIPVVFRCIDAVSVEEYSKHWIPFAGVLGYWGSYAGCLAATFGVGVYYICSPIAMLAERIVVAYVAPAFNDRLWQLACKTTVHPIQGRNR